MTTFNEKTMQRLITFYIKIIHYKSVKIKKNIQNVLYVRHILKYQQYQSSEEAT